MKRYWSEQQIQSLQKLIIDARNVAITCHLSPDGDAIGSSLALYHVLRKIGKNVRVIVPDQIPKSLSFLPGWKNVIVYSISKVQAERAVAESDLIFCLDFNDLYRLDNLSHVIEAAQGAKVMIDHHLNPSGFADLTISEPRMSSTCELLYRVLADLGLAGRMLGKVGATCVFTGMMTDTGNFTYNSSDPEIYEIVAELCRQGIDKESIYNAAMNTNSADQLRLNGYALYDKLKLWTDKHAALITLDKKELQRFNYRKGDTEGLVNKPLTIPDIFWVAFLREDEKYIKVSMRSRGDFDVSKMCNAHFNGGGHKNAAGGEFYGTMEECVALFEHLVNTYTFK